MQGLSLLSGSLMGAASLSVKADTQLSQLEKGESRKTFVLVHGAWHGGWCWRDVRNMLLDAGHRVFTPTLTGLGEREHLSSEDINLSTHVQDVINLIHFEELSNVSLVGHSYAGYVVSLVADTVKDQLAEIIYLDASIPEEGKPFFPADRINELLELYGSHLRPGSLEFLGLEENTPEADWVLKHLRPHPIGCFIEPVVYKNNGAAGVPKTFIRCTGNPRSRNDPILEMTEDDAEWQYVRIEAGHNAMVTEPAQLSKMLLI